MSIHAHLSPEAQLQLRAQKRNSTISSIVISVLVIVLIFLVLGIFLLPNIIKESPTIVTYAASLSEETDIQQQKVKNQIPKKPSAPANSMAKVIASNNTSTTAIPVPDIEVTTPSADFGDGQDFGGGWGDEGDTGAGGGFGAVPTEMQKRCSKADRLARLAETGGTPECEDAVVKALDWLQKTQNEDGSWTSGYQAAMTGFAVLAYLGHCETPLSEKYGETVLKGITYLINVGLKNDGKLASSPLAGNGWVYEHGIATYALAEAYTFCSKLNINIPDLDTVTKKAGDIIIKGQSSSGGWSYRYEEKPDGDNSVGFWQIQALKACKHTGLWNDSNFTKVSRKALDWLEKSQGENGAIGYRGDSKRSPGLTGGGVLAFQMWGEGKSKEARKGINYLKNNTDFKWGTPNDNLYYHYYNAQALINEGGKVWNDYNEKFRDQLLKAQAPDGSWSQTGHGNHGPANSHMATCLATFMLEVYYRFLPGTTAR